MKGTKIFYFLPMVLENIFGESVFPRSPIGKKITRLEIFIELSPRDKLNLVVTLTNIDTRTVIFPKTTRW